MQTKLYSALFIILLLLGNSFAVEIKKSTSKTKLNSQAREHSKAKVSKAKKLFSKTTQNPAEWTQCAVENGTCTVPSTTIVVYGAVNGYLYQEVTGSIGCNNGVWTDPSYGNVKSCHYKNIPYTWVQCASENGTCSFIGSTIVSYTVAGVGTHWGAFTNSTPCNNSVFGDPAYGHVKTCYYLVESDWTTCAQEHGTCNLNGTTVIRFGNPGTYNYMETSGSVGCNDQTFGDPEVGTVKHCDEYNSTYTWVNCAQEHGTCTINGTAIVRFGMNGKYFYQSVTNSIGCNDNVFGDPDVGVVKACDYMSGTTLYH